MLLPAKIQSVSHRKAVCNVRVAHRQAWETFPAVPRASRKGHLSLALVLDALEVPKRDGTSQVWLYIFREKD